MNNLEKSIESFFKDSATTRITLEKRPFGHTKSVVVEQLSSKEEDVPVWEVVATGTGETWTQAFESLLSN